MTDARSARDVLGVGRAERQRPLNGYPKERADPSTTLFRFYRSTGGDSASRPCTARRTVRDVSHRPRIGSLATSPITATPMASIFATALQTADIDTTSFEGQPGGAYAKVMRWAFEKQGMYQPAGAPVPVTTVGAPPESTSTSTTGGTASIPTGRCSGRTRTSGTGWPRTRASPTRRRSSGGRTSSTSRSRTAARNRDERGRPVLPLPPGDRPRLAGRLGRDDDARAARWGADRSRRHGPRRPVRVDADRGRPRVPARHGDGPGRPEQHRLGLRPAVCRGADSALAPRSYDNNIAQRNVAPVAGITLGLIASFKKRRFWAHNPFPKQVKMVLEPVCRPCSGSAAGSSASSGRAHVADAEGAREPCDQDGPQGGEALQAERARGRTDDPHPGEGRRPVVGGLSYLIDPKLAKPPKEK